jgi:hypothetical protein
MNYNKIKGVTCLSLAIGILITSCNLKVFVNKDRVINKLDGLFFSYGESNYFIPTSVLDNKKIDPSFINGKTAYMIGTLCGVSSLTRVSSSFEINIIYTDSKNQIFKEKQTCHLISCTILYIKKDRSTINNSGIINFDFNSQKYSLNSNTYFNGEILNIDSDALPKGY